MNNCFKCGTISGLFVDDENGHICIKCHPTTLSNVLSDEENLKKLPDNLFTSLKNMRFKEK